MRPLRPSELRDLRAIRAHLDAMGARIAALEGAAMAPEPPIHRQEREADERMRAGVGEAMAREVARQERERLGEVQCDREEPPPPDYNFVTEGDADDVLRQAQDDREEEHAELADAVAIVADRRARPVKPAPKIDWNRVADAHARKAAEPKPAPVQRALPIAPDREGCRRCGIPGWRGCEHQLPCEPPATPAYRQEGVGPRLTVDGRRRPGAR